MMMERDQKVDALCDLNSAYAIIAICEGGVFRTPRGNSFANKIVKLCKSHAATQLRVIDGGSHD